MNVLEQIVQSEDDVFALRQRSRRVAALAGLDEADQVRLATALSEIGRDLLGGDGGRAVFEIDERRQEFVVSITGLAAADPEPVGVGAARRLVPSLQIVQRGGGSLITLRPRLPGVLTASDVASISQSVAALVVSSPLDELRIQNQELVGTLDQLRARHEEVLALNAELEETNAGVMAMYAQLSEELETTNRGVVALYAELDDTTRRLQEATEAKSRFLNSVSHELRSPVNSVLGLARLLIDPMSPELGDEQRHQLTLIISAASELLDLVNQLLDLARAESGKLQVTLERTDIVRVAGEIVDTLRPLAAERVTLDVRTASASVVVATDVQLVRQILRNLLSNALAFTTAGAVTVAISVADDAVAIEVRDTGIGIAAEHLDSVFDEFFQVRNSLQGKRRGSGLGLPYSRRVAERLGGSLTVHSAPGEGSTFTLRLPRASDVMVAPPHPDPVPVGRVLVVDDDAGFSALLTGLLAEHAAAIHEVDGGVAALAALRSQPIDLVLLDLVMPDLAGADVLAEMSRDPELQRIPVVVITSVDPAAIAVTAVGQVVDVLPKQHLDRHLLARALGRVPRGGR
jgi:signal transduction histidine kinase/CheY-like chemotaxis protein